MWSSFLFKIHFTPVIIDFRIIAIKAVDFIKLISLNMIILIMLLERKQ